ncbi:MAG: FIST N-terminal domain-containing protein [Polyangiaceae bacterium]
MKTTIATALAHGSAHEVAELLGQAVREQLRGVLPAFTAVFASTKQPLGELLPALKRHVGSAPLVGASTAGEFTAAGDAKGSAVVFAVAGDFRVFAGMAAGLRADVEGAVAAAARSLPATVDGYPHCTTVLLLDPLAGKGEEAVLIAAALLGQHVRLAGGAAGDDLQMTQTLCGLDAAVASDAIVLASIFSKQPLGVGVCHGHLPISGPLRVTRAEGNVVHEIEGRPAWDVWAEQTRERAAARGVDPLHLAPEEVGPFLLRYEAGLAAGSTYKIRAPLSRSDDGALGFACGIPEGSVIRITESEEDRQISSAREAARRALAQAGGGEMAGALVFDCICRNLILGPRFAAAVRSISAELGGAPVAGFETYGEIALDVGDMSGFHNTTTVVLAFPEGE